MNREQLKKEIASISNIKGKFILKSGRVSENYFDKFKFETQPLLLSELASEIIHTLPPEDHKSYWKNVDYISGLDLGAIPLVVMVSFYLNIPSLFIRQTSKPYGLGTYFEGNDFKGKRIQLIEDVITTGNSILNAATKLTIDGGLINENIFCIIDREEGGKENLEKYGFKLRSVFTRHELES